MDAITTRFPFVDWAELLEACHSMSKSNSPQEKSVKKHVRTHNCEIKNPSKHCQSAQMTRHFKQDPFIEPTSKEHQCNVMMLY